MTLDSQRSFDAIWRIESPKLIAALMRIVRDIDVAEELAQDAFVAALAQWPHEGFPRNPGAWLTTIGKRRAVDWIRREKTYEGKREVVGREQAAHAADPAFAAVEDEIDDDLLRLMFIACHPVLSTEARVSLTLRLLGGLTTTEIARAFLAPESTVAQRIVRAKRTLSEARAPFETPTGAERQTRLASVLEVIYLVFNEGYSATSGEDVLRPELCSDAMRVGRVLAELLPSEGEVHGLVALMEIQASRGKARVDERGDPVLLSDQDRGRWDRVLIQRGLKSLQRAEKLEVAFGPYALQAAIAACHARAPDFAATDWERIAALYDALAALRPSPVVQLNRAIAVGMAFGAQAGLDLTDALAGVAILENYHLLPAVRGDLLERLGRFSEARAEFERAATLTRNERERALLFDRAARQRVTKGKNGLRR